MIYGNCSQQLGTDSNSPLDLDGYGEEAVVISPASPQQLSDGRIMFIDDGRLIRVLRDGEVFTKTGKSNKDTVQRLGWAGKRNTLNSLF